MTRSGTLVARPGQNVPPDLEAAVVYHKS